MAGGISSRGYLVPLISAGLCVRQRERRPVDMCLWHALTMNLAGVETAHCSCLVALTPNICGLHSPSSHPLSVCECLPDVSFRILMLIVLLRHESIYRKQR